MIDLAGNDEGDYNHSKTKGRIQLVQFFVFNKLWVLC